MSENRRNGQRISREQRKRRIPNLGYYIIVTDTKQTEKNYFIGIRDSMPKELQEKLVIVVRQSRLTNIINAAKNISELYPQYSEPWIVFDRDQVKNFDDLIEEAKCQKINVGWSNPCIEIWFSAYLGTMPTYKDSVSCCDGFETDFNKVTHQKYDKADKKIYNKLCKYGDEAKAIKLAEQKLKEKEKQSDKPSQLCPATTVHKLVNEIKLKIEKEN